LSTYVPPHGANPGVALTPGILSHMPLYEYKCKKGHHFDVIQSFADAPITKCEICGAKAERVLSAPAIHFKGSGFYNTDYGTKRRAKENAEHKSESKSTSGDSSGADKSSSDSSSTSSDSSSSSDSKSSDSSSKKSEKPAAAASSKD
jgi:putative FmdB family regulatory protein